MTGETVDIVEENGKILRQAFKTDAHKHGWLHKTVIGCLREDNGDWWLVRQSADRQDAAKLVAPVGGHVEAGELDGDALQREAGEEIGTKNITYREIGRVVFQRQVLGRNENHLFVVYEIATDDPLVLGSEVASIHRFTPTELRHTLATTPEAFGAPYLFILQRFYPEYLPEGRNL